MKPKRPAKLKRHQFFCAGEWAEVRYTLRGAMGASRSAVSEERWLQEQKAEYIAKSEPNPEYWDTLKIFKVTIEEVQRTIVRQNRARGAATCEFPGASPAIPCWQCSRCNVWWELCPVKRGGKTAWEWTTSEFQNACGVKPTAPESPSHPTANG